MGDYASHRIKAFSLRMENELRRALQEEANKNGHTLTAEISHRLSKSIAGKMTFWVLYKNRNDKSLSPEREMVVTLDGDSDELFHDRLRRAVMPDRLEDPSDGLKAEYSSDCIILNWKELSWV